ncbi:hypothetical protein ACQP3L_34800, partial [Escherichia coli]
MNMWQTLCPATLFYLFLMESSTSLTGRVVPLNTGYAAIHMGIGDQQPSSFHASKQKNRQTRSIL